MSQENTSLLFSHSETNEKGDVFCHLEDPALAGNERSFILKDFSPRRGGIRNDMLIFSQRIFKSKNKKNDSAHIKWI
jgi:hypothetical protein